MMHIKVMIRVIYLHLMLLLELIMYELAPRGYRMPVEMWKFVKGDHNLQAIVMPDYGLEMVYRNDDLLPNQSIAWRCSTLNQCSQFIDHMERGEFEAYLELAAL